MKTTFVYNASPKLQLIPENPAEKLLLTEMAEASEKGATTILSLPKLDGGEFVLEVGRS